MDQIATLPDVEHTHVRFDAGILLDCGVVLDSHTVAYRTYGTLNAARTNAILVCHALTGDQYVAETHPVTGKPGWWDTIVGPGLPVDTDRFFVVCANVLGGCMGSTGPMDAKPDGSGERWGTDFPAVTIRDMVRAQKQLIDHLGIARLFAVLGLSESQMNKARQPSASLGFDTYRIRIFRRWQRVVRGGRELEGINENRFTKKYSKERYKIRIT